MKLQKVKIAIHPVLAELADRKPLTYLMTLDNYCYPLRTKEKELGHYCSIYFKKCYSKKELHSLNRNFSELEDMGIYIKFCNTMDNPCLIQNGHSPEYARYLYTKEEMAHIVKTVIEYCRPK